MIDASHGNSLKDHRNQPKVVANICEQLEAGDKGIMGVMIESNLVEGKQSLDGKKREELVYGQSCTDACISWEVSPRRFVCGWQPS